MNTERYLESFDGTRLYVKEDRVASPRALVIIVHGLCEHLGRYDPLVARLLKSNFDLFRFDHRGHGKSEGRKVYYRSFHELLDDVNHMVQLQKREHPELPVFLIGHSMGGFAVSGFGIKYPGQVKGIITSGALTMNNAGFGSGMPMDLSDDTYLPNELSEGVCSDPEVVRAYTNDPLVEKQISASLIYTLIEGVKWVSAHAREFRDPLFLLHGACDGIVSEKDSRDFFGAVSSEDKGLKIYPKLFHEIFNEPVKGEVYEELAAWLEKRC